MKLNKAALTVAILFGTATLSSLAPKPASSDVAELQCPKYTDDFQGTLIEHTATTYTLSDTGGNWLILMPPASEHPSPLELEALMETLCFGWGEMENENLGVLLHIELFGEEPN